MLLPYHAGEFSSDDRVLFDLLVPYDHWTLGEGFARAKIHFSVTNFLVGLAQFQQSVICSANVQSLVFVRRFSDVCLQKSGRAEK